MTEHILCKICIIQKGLRGSDLADGSCDYAFKSEDKLIEHLRKEHDLKVVINK